MGVQVALYDQPGGALIADYSSRVQKLSIVTNTRGFADCSGFIPLARQAAFDLATAGAPQHLIVTGRGAEPIFEGRLEDAALTVGGVAFRAFGYARTMSDAPYTALWSHSGSSDWRMMTNDDGALRTPEKYAADFNNRVYIALMKNTSYTLNADISQAMYQAPDGSSRDIIGISFAYTCLLPLNWQVYVQTFNSSMALVQSVLLAGATGALMTRTAHVSGLTAGAKTISILVYNNAGTAVYAGETGVDFFKATSIRIVTSTTNMINTTLTANRAAGANVTATVGSTARMYVGQQLIIAQGAAVGEIVVVLSIGSSTQFNATFVNAYVIGDTVQAHVIYADEIVKDLISASSTLNNLQLSSSTGLVQSPALDLQNELYEDRQPSDILEYLAGIGDNQTIPRQWEWGVYTGRMLFFRPQSVRNIWYIDLSELDVQFSIDALANSVYAVYQDASGRNLRTAASSDSTSIARYRMTRRTAISASTTSSTQAGIQASAALNDQSDPKPRAGMTITQVFDASGARWPLTFVRAGDTMIIRNLPPNLAAASVIDRIRTFRIARTQWDATTGALTIEPETPLPSLAALLAQVAAGVR